jgi:hypothetical protein
MYLTKKMAEASLKYLPLAAAALFVSTVALAVLIPPLAIVPYKLLGLVAGNASVWGTITALVAAPVIHVVGGHIAKNLATRGREFRADRNALATIGNYDVCARALTKMQMYFGKTPNEIKKIPADTLKYKCMRTHPGHTDRIANLKSVWAQLTKPVQAPTAKPPIKRPTGQPVRGHGRAQAQPQAAAARCFNIRT